MKSLTTSLIVFSLLGSAGAALACSQVLDAQTVPSSWQEGTIPVDGFIYVASGDEPTFDEQYTSIIDPEGAPVIWEFVDMEFSSGVLGVQPEGGWLLGDYAGASWSSEGLFRTVVDTVDTTAPDIGIDSWEGQSKQPASLVMDVDHLGPVAWDSSEQLAFWDSFLVTTAQSDKVDVTITGFDLSGNSSTVELLSARGCAGSGSSLAAGHGNGGLALASLLALAVLRRRRDRLEPTKV
jgi:MYXO-CTERM domain-containing protein